VPGRPDRRALRRLDHEAVHGGAGGGPAQLRPAHFEITDLNLTAGDDVAFAHALLRCGTPEDLREHPDHRLRLTIGLREGGRPVVVTHEHHSFPDRD
jgi:ketosteroid isomerase-like protein